MDANARRRKAEREVRLALSRMRAASTHLRQARDHLHMMPLSGGPVQGAIFDTQAALLKVFVKVVRPIRLLKVSP